VLLAKLGNGLSPFDIFDEADAVRSAEAYATEGFTMHHGLARLLYGSRFPTQGAVTDHLDTNGLVKPRYLVRYPEHLKDRNEWVYMHYPPGPALWCGVLARCFGLNHIWMWRLVPISLAFVSVIILFRTLASVFGVDRGALITLACAVLPMANTYMPGLYYESYSYSLQLLQLSLLIKCLWGGGWRWWHLPVLFLLGFVQGCMSFDFFFIVALAVVPLWLMRRAEGALVPGRWLCLGIGLPLMGFGLAHFLHLLQLAGELGGLRPAIVELSSTAVDRAGVTTGVDRFSYLKSFSQMSYLYIREFLRLYNQHFGPFLPLAVAVGVLVSVFRKTQLTLSLPEKQTPFVFSLSWPGPKRLAPALIAAFFVCALWPIVMPGANVGNFHIYPRDFFFFYFMLVLAAMKSIRVGEKRPADVETPVAPKS